jgi:hypothetical protein
MGGAELRIWRDRDVLKIQLLDLSPSLHSRNAASASGRSTSHVALTVVVPVHLLGRKRHLDVPCLLAITRDEVCVMTGSSSKRRQPLDLPMKRSLTQPAGMAPEVALEPGG